MINKILVLPITGTLIENNPPCGDNDDPLRPVGVQEFASEIGWKDIAKTNNLNPSIEMWLKDLNIDSSSCVVEVTAEENFFDLFEPFISSTPDILGHFGLPPLRRID
jgi:hypothetical protein